MNRLLFFVESKADGKQPREAMRTDGDVIPMVCGRLSNCHHFFFVLKEEKQQN